MQPKYSDYVKLIKCNVNGSLYYINIYSIIYIESTGHKLRIKTVSAEYVIRNSLKNFLKVLDENFYQTHQSYIINLNFIVAVSTSKVTLRGKNMIPIGRKYRDSFFKFIN